jgi:hypothetical protein
MDIALVLIAASALVGVAAGLRLKAFALVPVALVIALLSAAVLHRNGFGPGGGIVIIIGCLVLNQAAYILVQVLASGLTPAASLDDVIDGEPRADGHQAIDDDHGYQKPAPTFPPDKKRSKRYLL